MRCPRCHRVESSGVASCPGCGFEFTAVSGPGAGVDVRTDRVPIGPLQDFELRRPPSDRRPSPKARRRSAGRRTAASALRSRPLSVRRTTPDIPKFRAQDSALPLEASRELAASRREVEPSPAAADREERPDRLLGLRLAAGVLDAIILASINAAVIYLTLRMVDLAPAQADRLPIPPLTCFLLLFDATYCVTMTAYGGQTVGKMAARLRVEGRGGDAVSMVGALVRTLGYAVSIVPFGLGFVTLFLRSGRALHDLLADTRVVRVS